MHLVTYKLLVFLLVLLLKLHNKEFRRNVEFLLSLFVSNMITVVLYKNKLIQNLRNLELLSFLVVYWNYVSSLVSLDNLFNFSDYCF